jgi:hypothetical protein
MDAPPWYRHRVKLTFVSQVVQQKNQMGDGRRPDVGTTAAGRTNPIHGIGIARLPLMACAGAPTSPLHQPENHSHLPRLPVEFLQTAARTVPFAG